MFCVGRWPDSVFHYRFFPNEDAITRLVGAIPSRAERRVGRLKEIHDTGIHRSDERQSHTQAAHHGSLSVPALPAGYRVGRQALTPRAGTRSNFVIVSRIKRFASGFCQRRTLGSRLNIAPQLLDSFPTNVGLNDLQLRSQYLSRHPTSEALLARREHTGRSHLSISANPPGVPLAVNAPPGQRAGPVRPFGSPYP